MTSVTTPSLKLLPKRVRFETYRCCLKTFQTAPTYRPEGHAASPTVETFVYPCHSEPARSGGEEPDSRLRLHN